MYGTVLIISLSIVVAVVLAATGVFVVDQLTGETSDEVTQDTIFELADRLDDLTETEAARQTTFELPREGSNSVRSEPDGAVVNLTVETDEYAWTVTPENGSLVSSDNQTGFHEESIGTVVHESDDGVLTGYEGGGVWTRDGERVTVEQAPDLGVSESALTLSFVDVSGTEFLSSGSEQLLLNDPQESAQLSEQMQAVVDDQMTDEEGNVVAPVSVSLNVTSRFAEGWNVYATESLVGVEADDVELHERSGDRKTAEIELGTLGTTPTNVPDAPEYDDGVVYSGVAAYADDLYNGTRGTLAAHEDGFEVEDIDGDNNYTVGVLYDDGDGLAWWAWNDSYWINVEDPLAEPKEWDELDVLGEEGDDNKFDMDDTRAWVCVADTADPHDPGNHTDDGFGQFVPGEFDASAGNGCLTNPVDVEEPDQYTGEFRPLMEVTGFDAAVYDGTENVTGDGPFTVGDEHVEVNVTGENVGTADASKEPVAIVFDRNEVDEEPPLGMNEPEFVNATYNDTAVGEEFSVSSAFGPEQPGYYAFSAGTGHDDVAEDDRSAYRFTTDVEFDVAVTDVDDGVFEGSGEPVTVTAEVSNDGPASASQPVFVSYEDEPPLNATNVELEGAGGDNETEVSLSWEPAFGDAEQEEINVTTPDSYDTAAVEIKDAEDLDTDFEVQELVYDDEVEIGETTVIEATVENTGGDGGTQNVELRNESDLEELFDGTLLSLDEGEEETVELGWTPLSGDEGKNVLEVDTGDDEETATIAVTEPEVDAAFDVSIDDVSKDGDPVTVPVFETLNATVTVENTGTDEGTRQVVAENHSGAQVDQETVTLDGGESTQIQLVWATFPWDIGEGPFTVASPADEDEVTVEVVPREPEFDVTIVEWDQNVTEGEPLEVTGEIENTGTGSGSGTVVLGADVGNVGDRVNSTSTGTIDPGETENVTLTWFTGFDVTDGDPEKGEVILNMEGRANDDRAEATVEPAEGPPRDPPEYKIESLELSEDVVEEGQEVEVEADIQNDGTGALERPAWLFEEFTDLSFPVATEPVNVSAGESETVTITWDTSGAVNWSEQSGGVGGPGVQSGGSVTEELTYAVWTDDSEDIELTIERPPEPEFEVEITETNSAPDDPVIAGEETLEVEIDVENVGDAPVARDVVREDELSLQASGIVLDSTLVELEPGENVTETLTWETDRNLGPAIEEVQATVENDEDWEDVYIERPTPEFEIEIEDHDEQVLEGEPVDVTAAVTNLEDSAHTPVVELLDFENESVAVRSPGELAPGESENLTLSWLAPPAGEGTVTADVEGDEATAEVEVLEGTSGDFVVGDLETNADEGEEHIFLGETLEVEATVTNEGQFFDSQQVVLADETGGNELKTNGTALDDGEDETVSFEWQATTETTETIAVETDDDNSSTAVDIRSPDTGPLDVSVETNASTQADRAVAGEAVNVTATLSAEQEVDRDDVIVELEATLGTETVQAGVEWIDVDVDEDTNQTVSFTWETQPWHGNNEEPWSVSVNLLGSSPGDGERATAWLEETDLIGPGAPSGQIPVDIEVEDIQVS